MSTLSLPSINSLRCGSRSDRSREALSQPRRLLSLRTPVVLKLVALLSDVGHVQRKSPETMLDDLTGRLRPAEAERFLTPRDVAEITGLHVAVVRRAIERGELRAFKLCSRLRIRRQDFDAWVEQNVVAP